MNIYKTLTFSGIAGDPDMECFLINEDDYYIRWSTAFGIDTYTYVL